MSCAAVVHPHVFRRTAEPTVEPVALSLAQTLLRLPLKASDPATEHYIASVRDTVERYLERALLEQTWQARLDAFWGAADLELPRPNLLTVESIEYQASEADTWTEVDEDVYEVDTDNVPGRVRLKPLQSWPTAYARPNAVRVTYTAGYGTTDASVPAVVKQLCMFLLGHFERHREGVVVGTISNLLPLGVRELLELERVPWVGD